MTTQELDFATHHQAAHVLAAVTLGYGVTRVSPTETIVEEDWGIIDAPIEDVAAVCAAGFAYEQQLGRTPEEAWARCKNDRSLLAALYADRTGIALEDVEVTEMFYRGVESSRAILRHPAVMSSIGAVAERLKALFEAGEPELAAEEIRRLVAPMSERRVEEFVKS